MSARIALSHLISSSSLGAQRSSVRFVVTTLNVCVRVPAPSASSGAAAAAVATRRAAWGDAGGGEVAVGWFRFGGRSYSSASMMSESGICRCGFVSCVQPSKRR